MLDEARVLAHERDLGRGLYLERASWSDTAALSHTSTLSRNLNKSRTSRTLKKKRSGLKGPSCLSQSFTWVCLGPAEALDTAVIRGCHYLKEGYLLFEKKKQKQDRWHGE